MHCWEGGGVMLMHNLVKVQIVHYHSCKFAKINNGENKTSQRVSVCVLLISEWVNEVQVWWGNQGKWVIGDSCVIGVMVDGNVWVQCMMGDVVHGWCAVVVSGSQIHNKVAGALCTNATKPNFI